MTMKMVCGAHPTNWGLNDKDLVGGRRQDSGKLVGGVTRRAVKIRNPKQIQITKIQMFKTKTRNDGRRMSSVILTKRAVGIE
jgi:hypothetical protein